MPEHCGLPLVLGSCSGSVPHLVCLTRTFPYLALPEPCLALSFCFPSLVFFAVLLLFQSCFILSRPVLSMPALSCFSQLWLIALFTLILSLLSVSCPYSPCLKDSPFLICLHSAPYLSLTLIQLYATLWKLIPEWQLWKKVACMTWQCNLEYAALT